MEKNQLMDQVKKISASIDIAMNEKREENYKLLNILVGTDNPQDKNSINVEIDNNLISLNSLYEVYLSLNNVLFAINNLK